jgi:hypothetical protein
MRPPFEWKRLQGLDVSALQPYYDRLPLDPYVKEGFRFKQLSRVRWINGAVVVQPHRPLFQSKQYNPTHGGIERNYEPIPADAFRLPALISLLSHFASTFPEAATRETIIQFQRIRTLGAHAGLPAVEGWHQDDVDGLAIALVNMRGCSGAVSGLKDLGGRMVFEKVLAPGELLLVNDRLHFHYTSPILPNDPSVEGTRDVVLLSLPE